MLARLRRGMRRRMYLLIGAILTHPRFHPIHHWLYRRTGGWGIVGRALGVEMLLLTTTGRRSGRSRTVPLVGLRAEGARVVVGSNGGADEPPSWALNLRADPRATVQAGKRQLVVRAREASGDEEARLWRVATAAYPGYAVYRETTDRRIPLFVLEPVAAGVE